MKTNKTFCCTGKLTRPRKEIQKFIAEQGGTYKGSIAKDLNYLIIGDGAKQHKIDKAKKNGTEILTEEEFIVLSNES